jgi:hypothetical protein
MGASETWGSQSSKLDALFLLFYINNLSKIISQKSNPVLFAKGMCIIILNSNPMALRNNINEGLRPGVV